MDAFEQSQGEQSGILMWGNQSDGGIGHFLECEIQSQINSESQIMTELESPI